MNKIILVLIGVFLAPAAYAQNCPIIPGLSLGGTDTAPALNAALAALPAEGGCLSFPAGKFTFNSRPAFTLSNGRSGVKLVGAGSSSTKLYWPSGLGGMQFTWANPRNSVQIEGLRISTGVAAGGVGVELRNVIGYNNVNSQNRFVDVVFDGDDSALVGGVAYWSRGLWSHGVGNLTCDACQFNGRAQVAGSSGDTAEGMWVEGDDATNLFATIITVQNSQFNFLHRGFTYGSRVQGVTINASNFNQETGDYGVGIPAGAVDVALLTITNSQFNVGGTQIELKSPIGDFTLTGNVITTRKWQGIGVYATAGGASHIIVGNLFNSQGPAAGVAGQASGFNIDATGMTVTGNIFNNLYAGAIFNVGTWYATLIGNSYPSTTIPYLAVGAASTNPTNKFGVATP